MRTPALLIALCVALLVAGCGGSGDSSSGSTAAAGTTAAATTTLNEPKVVVPHTPPPKKLVVRELKKGSGPEAKAGDIATLQYLGVNWKGDQFADSRTYTKPPEFELGEHRLIPGLEVGILGMRPGGRRELLIPASLSYNPDELDSPPPAYGALVFVVDLLKLK